MYKPISDTHSSFQSVCVKRVIQYTQLLDTFNKIKNTGKAHSRFSRLPSSVMAPIGVSKGADVRFVFNNQIPRMHRADHKNTPKLDVIRMYAMAFVYPLPFHSLILVPRFSIKRDAVGLVPPLNAETNGLKLVFSTSRVFVNTSAFSETHEASNLQL